jgi:dihydroorotate dehydrogenase
MKSGGRFPIVGVGGVDSVVSAREKLDAGASLVQIYSGLIYEGPGLASRLVNGLKSLD